MAPKNANTTQNLLYLNLFTLMRFEESSYQLKECVKPGSFSKINRVGFEQVMYFLINAYDPHLCRSMITCWPIIERKTQERIFRREVVAAYAKITSQDHFGLLPFSQSFLSSPGGKRLETFLCKLSALSLRTVLERRSQHYVPNPPKGLTPRRCLTIAQSRAYAAMNKFLKIFHQSVCLMKKCAEDARSLNEDLIFNQLELKRTRRVLTELHINEADSVEDVFNNDIETELRQRVQTFLESLEVIQNQEKVVAKCETVARLALADQRGTAVLDRSEHLDIAVLLSSAADTVESISSRLCRHTNPAVHRMLLDFREKLSDISQLMEKTLKSVIELAATSSTQPAECVSVNMGTPDRFRHAWQLLEDASHATPPLEFHPAAFNPIWQTISEDTASPPISSVADLVCAQKTIEATGHTSMHLGKRPLSRAVLQTPQIAAKKALSCTPARPRSEIPVKIASKTSKPLVQTPSDVHQKAAASRPSSNSFPEVLTIPVRLSKVSLSNDSPDIRSNGDVNKEDSAQNVLDLAVSVLTPLPTGNSSLKSAAVLSEKEEVKQSVEESPKLDKHLALLKFSESMIDSPVTKVSVTEPNKAVTDKKPAERRKTILDLIERYRDIVPAGDSPVTSVELEMEPDEWKDSDIDIIEDSDVEEEENCIQYKFALSPGF